MLSKFAVASTVLSLALLAGCANKACCEDGGEKKAAAPTASDAKVAVINTMCPIGGDDFDAKERPAYWTRTVSGQNIGFCCEHCVEKFDKMSEEKKQAVLVAARSNKAM